MSMMELGLQFYGRGQQLEYDIVVEPGADPEVIKFAFEGAGNLEIDQHGNLVSHVTGGQLIQKAPFIYQDDNGSRTEIEGGFVLDEKGNLGFQLSQYDTSKPLIIDPVLLYSTYLGGSGGEDGHDIVVDGVR